jgi:hypothetical protein
MLVCEAAALTDQDTFVRLLESRDKRERERNSGGQTGDEENRPFVDELINQIATLSRLLI